MAYAVKYRMNFNTVQNDGDDTNTTIDWQVDIYVEGFAGSVTAVNGGSGDPVKIVLPQFEDIFEPVCSSNAVITIMATSNDQFTEFQSADTYGAYVDIIKDGSTYWKGVYVTEPYIEPFRAAPYPVQLTFNDGLAELQYERYDDSGTLRANFTSCIDILTKCFSFLPFTRKTRELINIFEDTLNDGDTRGLLEQLEIFEQAFWELDTSDDLIKGENCLEVIRGIMKSLGCRIIVSQDIWYIIRIGEMFDTSIKYVEYDVAGAVDTNNTIDLRRAIDKTATGASLLQHLQGGNNTINREYQEVQFSYTSKNITTLNNNVLINWNFGAGFELENGSPVPLHYTRSAAVNTSIGVTATGLHLANLFVPSETNQEELDEPTQRVLVMGNSLLDNTKTVAPPTVLNDVLQVDATRETYFLTPKSPADATVTVKNLLTDDSDHLEIHVKGWTDYTFATTLNLVTPMTTLKWTVKLGTKYYNTSNQTWDTTATNRVFTKIESDFLVDEVISGTVRRKRFDRTIRLADFPADSTDDLTVTWFIPETMRGPNDFQLSESVSSAEVVFEQMEIRYVSNDSTEFSVQKALGETSSLTLRRKRYQAIVKHGDGPSNFSIMSFREPTTNLATTTWSVRGAADALPGYKILIIDAIMENLGTLRQVFSGPLYGALELHNTVSGIDSKVYAIKGYDYSLIRNTIGVKLHEVGALSPVIAYVPQFDLSGITFPSVSDGTSPNNTEQQIDSNAQPIQGVGTMNVQTAATTYSEPITNNNDSTETGLNYPL